MNQESFSDRLRAVRKALGLSQAAFARLGGVRKGAQIHYEAGRRLPNVSYLSALSVAGVDVAYLLTGSASKGMGEGPATRGARLKELRSALGWSQSQAADLARVRREMWAKYEAGAEPGAGVLTALAEAGWDVLYILTGRISAPIGEGFDARVQALRESAKAAAAPVEAPLDSADAAADGAALEADVLRQIEDCFLFGISGREILAIFHRVPEALVLNAIRRLLEAGEIDAYHPVSRRLLDPRTLA